MKKLFFVVMLILFASPLLCHAAPPGFMKARMGTLSGQVQDENEKPLTGGGVVSFFKVSKGIPPLVANMHRIPDTLGRMEQDGRFSVKLLPGTYYMGAMIISDPGRGPGPPREGEVFYFARDEKGDLLKLTLGQYEDKDVGLVMGGLPGSFPVVKDLATIAGKILHEDGQPFEGAFVMLKVDMNSQRPDYVSQRTGKDGSFLLKIPSGKYYVLSREKIIGGRPSIGDFVGVFGKDSLLGGALPGGGVERLGPGVPLKSEDGASSGEQDAAELDERGNSGFLGGIGSVQAGSAAVIIELKKGESLIAMEIIMYQVPDPVGTREKLLQEGQQQDDPAEFQAPFKTQEQDR